MDFFDLLIIGGGPAGYNAAEIGAKHGLKVALVEKETLGGVCLHEGCIPSKTMLHSAKIYESIKSAKRYGITVNNATFDQKIAIKRKDKIIKLLTEGIKSRMEQNGVSVITSHAYIKKQTENGFIVSANNTDYLAKNLLICTGSEPILPHINGLSCGIKNGYVLTTTEILNLDNIPKALVVIGGGITGLETACYYNAIGSEVTVVESSGQIAGSLDCEISDTLQKELSKKGIKFKTNCTVTKIEQSIVEIKTQDGKQHIIEADKVFCSAGRKAAISELGLENIGIKTLSSAIATDEHMKTNIDGVYAAGDVTGKSMLAHTAFREGEVAVNNILGKNDIMRYDAIPSVIYTNPEVSFAGETSESAKQKGIDTQTVTVSMRRNGRFILENDGKDGICKVITDKTNGRIVGVHILGNSSSEIIYGAAMMIDTKIDIEKLKEVVFPHPTVSEVIKEALFEK